MSPHRQRPFFFRKSLGTVKLVIAFASFSFLAWPCAATQGSDPVARARRWKERESPAAVETAAKELLDGILLEEKDLRANSLNRRTDLLAAGKLYSAKQYGPALEGFIRYFLIKLRSPVMYGLPGDVFHPWGRQQFDPQADRAVVLAAADKLLANSMVIGGTNVLLGEPGTVNWNYPFAMGAVLSPKEEPDRNLMSFVGTGAGAGFGVLVNAYVLTHDRRYLDKWLAFAEDWAMNAEFPDTVHPCNVGDTPHNSAVSGARTLLVMLAAIAEITPSGEEIIPPRIFAKLVKRRLIDYQLFSLMYLRSNTHNWTPSTGLLLNSLCMDEFKAAPLFFREGLRREVEDNAVTQNLRDGSENQQDPWYNAGSYFNVYPIFQILDARREIASYNEPPWVLAWREDNFRRTELREHFRERANYLIHLRTPQNAWPVSFGGDGKRQAGIPDYSRSPEAFDDPVNGAILDAMIRPAEGNRPPYDSEWFPYGGYNIVRDGWEANSACGSLFCSPTPGAYGGYRSRNNNNFFSLSVNGQNLFVEDNDGHYMYPTSPLTVDGINQYFHAGIYKVPAPAGHKVYQVSAWLDPAPWRWHASPAYNLMEGVYAGPWSKPPAAEVYYGPYGKEDNRQGNLPLDPKMLGPVHQRTVLYSRSAKLWIVTDTLRNRGLHSYEQVWWVPLGQPPNYRYEQVRLDEANARFFTAPVLSSTNAGEANQVQFSMEHFARASIAYRVTKEVRHPRPNGRVLEPSGWAKVGVSWQCEGDSELVTAICPQANATGGNLREKKALKSGKAGVGFEAVAPEGKVVRYLASTVSKDSLVLKNVAILGEALLLSENGGVALGCAEFKVDGKLVAIPNSDFEFTLSGTPGEAPMFRPIYRPISPVTIGPERNQFNGSEDVTLASKTPGVEIRFTSDGSDPTPQSAKYTGPIRLTRTTVVRARAYRPGVTTNPVQPSGTFATAVSYARFTRTNLIDPVKPRKQPGQGMLCRYWQADWRNLFLNLDRLAPQVTGTVGKLWDLSLVPADNPALGSVPAPREKYYAVEYRALLEIPEDGVYTLHAPREFVWPDVHSGYELRVELGNKVVPFGNRTQVIGLNEWYPATRLHALGTWSIGLKKGLHPLRIVFMDFRTHAAKLLNEPGVKDYIWTGVTPDLRISGGGLVKQPIPSEWLRCAAGSQ